METLAILTKLTEVPGPSGREHVIRQTIEAYWTPLSDETRTDALGNLIALKQGSGAAPRPALMIAAHMDEIGLIITGYEDEFLRVHTLGGMDRRVLLGLEVIVHGKRDLPGVIGTRPPHVLSPEKRKQMAPWEGIFIDLGLPADKVRDLVQVGDHVTIARPLITLKNDRVAGKAIDNRASVAAVTLTLESLQQQRHLWDVYAVATVQEEVGAAGALTGAYGLRPHLAITLDVTFAQQHDDNGTGTFELDQGPTIGIGPNFHPHLVRQLKEAARAEEIPYQIEPAPGSSGTDAWRIQIVREGIPSGLLSIPIRYMHQPVETVCLKDIERTARLLTSFITRLEADYRPQWEDEA